MVSVTPKSRERQGRHVCTVDGSAVPPGWLLPMGVDNYQRHWNSQSQFTPKREATEIYLSLSLSLAALSLQAMIEFYRIHSQPGS